jgi:hypothetical protein
MIDTSLETGAHEPVRYPRRSSPCLTCPTSPCCTYLPLHTFQVTTMVELDHAAYLLNFDRIELGLSASGTWTVAYRQACRHLDPVDRSCRVHGTPEQPQICARYNPHHCWYKRVLTSPTSPDHIRLDRRRFEQLVAHLEFDDGGDLVACPPWAELVELLADPIVEPPLDAGAARSVPPPDAVPVQFVDPPRRRRGDDLFTYAEVGNPCDGCAAHCCTKLLFPYPVPAARSNLDHLRFCLGFPGVSVSVADGAWSLVVDTTCRHLDGGRCAVHGQPERPDLCTYYDEWTCAYRVQFGDHPAAAPRARGEQWELLVSCFRFDAEGNVVEMLTADGIGQVLAAGRPVAELVAV